MPSSPFPLAPRAEAFLPTRFGDFRIFAFAGEDGAPATVLATAAVLDDALVRVHSECETGDVFGSLRCDCGAQLHAALERIARDGNGLLIYLRGHEGRGIGIVNKIRAYALQEQGQDTVEANRTLGFPADLRRYETAGRVLKHFGVSRLRLLSNNPAKVRAIQDMGLVVSRRVPLIEGANPHNEDYLDTKRRKMGHFGE